MKSALRRYTAKMGIKLKLLHAWNAWVVLALAVSGIILYLPALRGATAPVRVALKQGHIALGVVSIVLLLLYVPFLRKHVKQLRGKRSQAGNLTVVLVFLIGWSVSGVVLWFERSVPPYWTSMALLAHDLLTWVGVPYAIFHSVTRSRWVRQRRAAAVDMPPINAADSAFRRHVVSRRSFLMVGIGSMMALALGPSIYRWLKRATDDGGIALDALSSADSAAATGIEPIGQGLL